MVRHFTILLICHDFQFPDTFVGFGTSVTKVAKEFFKINGGKEGYYLANLLDKKYYYCGKYPLDVKVKLIELGIGKPDPFVDS